MARWAGEGKDWIQHMIQTQPRKEDVIRNLLESMKQALDKKKDSKRSVPTKKPRICLPSTSEHRYLERHRHWRSKETNCGLDERPRQDENEDWHSGEGTKPPTGMVGSRVALTAANHRLGHPYLCHTQRPWKWLKSSNEHRKIRAVYKKIWTARAMIWPQQPKNFPTAGQHTRPRTLHFPTPSGKFATDVQLMK